MKHTIGTGLVAAAALIALGPFAAVDAEPPVNVRGTITRVEGNTVDIKKPDGQSAEVRLASNATVVSVAKAATADIKPGSFIGTAATPRTDGTLQAIEIHIFPESMRGTGEGNRAWDLRPGSSMTNGTVAPKSGRVDNNKVSKVEGNKLIVDYNGGTKVVAITPSTKVVALVPGNASELKPNAQVFIPAAAKTADGTLTASRITVGKDGTAPPM
jgi:hypothetical protein